MAGAFYSLFHDGSCLVSRQSAVSRSQTHHPCFPEDTPVPIGSMRQPSHRLFGRTNGYLKAVVFKDHGCFPACDEHDVVPRAVLLVLSYPATADKVPQIFKQRERTSGLERAAWAGRVCRAARGLEPRGAHERKRKSRRQRTCGINRATWWISADGPENPQRQTHQPIWP